jgi:hypothetical protein
MIPVAGYVLRPTSLGIGTSTCGEEFQYATCRGSGDLEEIYNLDAIRYHVKLSK